MTVSDKALAQLKALASTIQDTPPDRISQFWLHDWADKIRAFARELDAEKGGAWAALNGDAASGDFTPPAQAAEAAAYQMREDSMLDGTWANGWHEISRHRFEQMRADFGGALSGVVGDWPREIRPLYAIAAMQAGDGNK